MTRRLIRLLLLSMIAIMGWAFGFIKVPYVERNYSFWIGFAGCLGMIAFVISLFQVWNNGKSIKLFETANGSEMGLQKQRITKNKMLLSFIFIVLLLCCIFIYSNNIKINEKLNLATTELNDLKNKASLEQQRNNISLLLELINKLDSTKEYFQDKHEADDMIDRITTLSSSFKIHKVWDVEDNVFQSLSSERGLLLLALIKTKMDTNYFNQIKENVSFYGADLRNADFHGLNLSGIDLKYAHLENAILQGTNLNNANLKGTNLTGVNLNHASLVGANLIATKLNWAKVNEADLQMAKLDSADLSNATVQKSNLNHASLISSVICNANFLESDLSYCYLLETNMSNANLSKTILTNANIYYTDFGNTILNDAIVRENWKERLINRKNSGVNSMLEKYRIVCDSTSIQDSIIYRLMPNIF